MPNEDRVIEGFEQATRRAFAGRVGNRSVRVLPTSARSERRPVSPDQGAQMAEIRSRDPTEICPSEVARIVAGAAWRSAMSEVRELALAEARAGRLLIRQHGAALGRALLPNIRGPFRIATPPSKGTPTASRLVADG